MTQYATALQTEDSTFKDKISSDRKLYDNVSAYNNIFVNQPIMF